MKTLALLLLLFASSALAADRHVYLNSTGGGSQLNDCPNPAHNAKGIAGNTDELQYCAGGGVTSGKIIGAVTGTITSVACTTDGGDGVGVVTAVANGVSADVDRDGTNEFVYGHPQACVWAMAKYDSCEVHAGVYSNPGARAGAQTHTSGTDGNNCNRTECWNADMVFLGRGSGVGLTAPGTGYGDSTTQGLVIGARMLGSQDTWDSDNDRVPDCDGNSGTPSCWGTCTGGTYPGQFCKTGSECVGTTTCTLNGEGTSYPAIMDGNADLFPMTVCDTSGSNPATCNKGAFFSLMFGCGPSSGGDGTVCTSSSTHGIYIDANADGVFDPSTEELGPRSNGYNSSWITIMDIESRKHNGGSACVNNTGTRDLAQGSIAMVGAPTGARGQGYTVEHNFFHDDLYAAQGLCDVEANTAMLGDNINHNTQVPGRFRKNLAIVSQKFFLNMDGGEYELVGGSKHINDNTFIFPPRVKQPDGSISAQPQSWGRIKGLDVVWNDNGTTLDPHVTALWNNEFIFQNWTGGGTYPGRFIQNETWGRSYHAATNPDQGAGGPRCAELPAPGVPCTTLGAACGTGGAFTCGGFWGPGAGQLWINGNIFRFQGSWTSGWDRAFNTFCTVSSGCGAGCPTGNANVPRMRTWIVGNTFDMERPGSTTTTTWGNVCEGSGTPQQSSVYVNRNNAWFGATSAMAEPTTSAANCATTADRRCVSNNVCSSVQSGCTTNGTGRTGWFAATSGTAGKNAGTFAGRSNYAARATGPLDNTGSCDPDGDGVAGMDWNHDGVNDTSWTDIAGSTVSCPTIGTVIDAGAIQVAGPACGNGAVDPGETCDNGTGTLPGNLENVIDCEYNDSPPLTQQCNASCTGQTNCEFPQYCGDSAVQTLFESCDGALLNGHVCTEFPGCTSGTPTCVACTISSAGCVCGTNPDLQGVDIFGVSINP